MDYRGLNLADMQVMIYAAAAKELAAAKEAAKAAITAEAGEDTAENVIKAAEDAKAAIEAAATVDAVTKAKNVGIEAIKAAKAANAGNGNEPSGNVLATSYDTIVTKEYSVGKKNKKVAGGVYAIRLADGNGNTIYMNIECIELNKKLKKIPLTVTTLDGVPTATEMLEAAEGNNAKTVSFTMMGLETRSEFNSNAVVFIRSEDVINDALGKTFVWSDEKREEISADTARYFGR